MFRMTAKYMTYVYVNDVTIKIEKKQKDEYKWRKKEVPLRYRDFCGNSKWYYPEVS